MTTETLASKCVVCRTHLERLSFKAYRGDPMHMIIGPGSVNQMSTVTELYCPQCGIKYLQEPVPPKPKKIHSCDIPGCVSCGNPEAPERDDPIEDDE